MSPRETPPALRVLSWGAGLDSTTLALLAHHGQLPPLDALIFADTLCEPQEVYDTIAWMRRILTVPIYCVSVGNLAADILAARQAGHRVGKPPFFVKPPGGLGRTKGGMLRRQCTNDYKIVPIRQQIRRLLGAKTYGPLPRSAWVEQWIGFPVEELRRQTCSQVQWITHRYPLTELRMHKQDCIQWLQKHGYPVPPKSSCTFCPYHDNAYWRRLRDSQPKEWAQVTAFDRELRKGSLSGVQGTVYIHRSLVPLDMAPIDEPDNGQQRFCFVCNT